MSRLHQIGTHKTAVYTDSDGATCVKYHQTVVAKREPSGRITLNSGGWQTATTKTRMNQCLRLWSPSGSTYYVHQVKHVWYVGVHKGNGVHERVCEYYDGVTLQ